LLYFFKVDIEVFRTAWFVESLISEVIAVFAIRTMLSFYKSKPSKSLLLVSILTIAAAVIFPYFAFGKEIFQFVALNWQLSMFILAILVAYFISIEIGKKYFFRKWGMLEFSEFK
jgi:Mg2+-importing ATPase